MKVLIIQPWIKNGGAELISLHLAYDLEKAGHEAKIAALFVNNEGLPDIYKKVRFILPPEWVQKVTQKNRLWFFIFGSWYLTKIVWKNAAKFNILNPHNFPSVWISSLVGKIKKVPVVWSCNEPPLMVPFGDFFKVGLLDFVGWAFASSFIDRFLIKKFVKSIMVLDEKNQKKVKDVYGLNSFVNYIGVDYDLYRHGRPDSVYRKYRLKDRFILFSAGKLHPQKNQRLCILALKKIEKKIPNAVLVLAGDGQDRKNLKRLTKRLNLTNKVIFLGFQTPKEISNWLAVANLNLFSPKGHQSWGLVPLEALCAGKLSIVTNTCGVSYLIAKEKIGLVAKLTAGGFAGKIIDVYQNQSKYKKIAQKGTAYVAKNLTWKSYCVRCLNAFNEAIGGTK